VTFFVHFEGRAEGPSVWHKLARAVLRAVLAALLALALAAINPFGLARWTEARSHEIWERIQAPLYADRHPIGRPAITIVSINEKTLSALHRSRPLDMATHGMILSDVIETPAAGQVDDFGLGPYRPAAVFVDLLMSRASSPEPPLGFIDFPTQYGKICETQPKSFMCYVSEVARYTRYDKWGRIPGCQSDTLSKLICMKMAGGLPIIFADDSNARNTGEDDERPAAIKMLDKVAATVPAFISMPDYPLIERPQGAENGVSDPEALSSGERVTLSPAAALWALYCMDAPRRCRIDPWTGQIGHTLPPMGVEWSPAFAGNLDVKWATGGDQLEKDRKGRWRRVPDPFVTALDGLHRSFRDRPCLAIRGISGAAYSAALMLFSGIHLWTIDRDCPYSHDLPYQDISAPGADPATLRMMLSGKLVLIGEEFKDSADIVDASPQGALPGVYSHAMALDILLQKSPDEWSAAKHLTRFLDVTSFDAQFAFVAFWFELTFALTREFLPLNSPSWRRGGRAGAILEAAWPALRFLIALSASAAPCLLIMVSFYFEYRRWGTLIDHFSFWIIVFFLTCLVENLVAMIRMYIRLYRPRSAWWFQPKESRLDEYLAE
jgi:hypothetical protein